MITPRKATLALLLVSPHLFGQSGKLSEAKPYAGQSTSTFSFTSKDNEQSIQISNVTYEVTNGATPGLPPNERLVLRKSVRTKQVIGDMGEDGSATVEAWAFGVDFRQKPLYTLSVNGEDPTVVDGELIQVRRGLEEIPWWSLYKLGSGQHLLDTYVPLSKFSISRETRILRYAGLEGPPDDASDALKDPHAVAVLTYASASRVIREALITAEDPKQAALLRSFADTTRLLETVERDSVVRSLRLTMRQGYPSAPNPVVMTIPLAGDNLDTAHAQMPARLHIAVWKR